MLFSPLVDTPERIGSRGLSAKDAAEIEPKPLFGFSFYSFGLFFQTSLCTFHPS